MPDTAKREFSERDICSKFITPALVAGNKWDLMSQIREEVFFTKGRVIATHLLDATLRQILNRAA